MKQPKYITDALKSFELATSLETIACDDKKAITDYTLVEVWNEARYILSLFHEGGTSSHDEYIGEYGREAQLKARKEVKILAAYIRRYTGMPF